MDVLLFCLNHKNLFLGQKLLRWPKFYSHKVQDDIMHDQIGQVVWALGGIARDFYSCYNSVPCLVFLGPLRPVSYVHDLDMPVAWIMY